MRSILHAFQRSKSLPNWSNLPTFFSRHMTGNASERGSGLQSKNYVVKFIPDLMAGTKVVIPVSLGRYAISNKNTKEYDAILNTLFMRTASLLQSGFLSQVDVISTADLQRINWSNAFADQIEQHFLKTHRELLHQQSNSYQWKEWIDKIGEEIFEEKYNMVRAESHEGSEWYNLMKRTHNSVKMSPSWQSSLEYQRKEYTAILLMDEYHHLVYTGQISLAWAYMYHLFPERSLPVFTRASFEAPLTQPLISAADASHTTKILLDNLELTLTNSNFPRSEKENIINKALSLIYAYEPTIIDSEKNKAKEDCEKNSHLIKKTLK